uniref:Inward rectifier potassium channel C-terminal domain-containing protein n=1 Tax=Arcella intermedia TaxID=1963864 RepID=A0A6B2L930_9EUKA
MGSWDLLKADSYHYLVNMSWWRVALMTLFYFIVFNSLFATLYWIDLYQIGGVGPNPTWGDAFFFSIQTMATIGYGYYHPKGIYINSIVCVEAWLSFTFNAIFTGMIITKVQRPARLRHTMKFSEVATINKLSDIYTSQEINNLPDEYNGGYEKGHLGLSFRIINLRKRLFCMPDLRLMLLKRSGRNYVVHELEYEINRQVGRPRAEAQSKPHLQLPWTITHPINRTSPLFGKNLDDFVNGEYEVICVIDGVDELSSLNFQCRWSYIASEIYWDHIFVPMLSRDPQSGAFQIETNNLSKTVPINQAPLEEDSIELNESSSLLNLELL